MNTISRIYKKTEIDEVMLGQTKTYIDNGVLREQLDTNELTSILGRKFEVRSICSVVAKKYHIRGGHLEHKNKVIVVMKGAFRVVLIDMRGENSKGKVVCADVGIGKNKYDVLIVPSGFVLCYMALVSGSIISVVSDKSYNHFESVLTMNAFDPLIKKYWPKGAKLTHAKNDKEIVSFHELSTRKKLW